MNLYQAVTGRTKMVLNPAIIQDPDSDDIHMLFRATGPWPQKRREGCHDPYPIFLGYARSRDRGETWEADFSKTCSGSGPRV
ncbi:hypothetical protein ACFSQ7_39265 [Paenibacillus rhizoplanae]